MSLVFLEKNCMNDKLSVDIGMNCLSGMAV